MDRRILGSAGEAFLCSARSLEALLPSLSEWPDLRPRQGRLPASGR
jgi:hypothetical protein